MTYLAVEMKSAFPWSLVLKMSSVHIYTECATLLNQDLASLEQKFCTQGLIIRSRLFNIAYLPYILVTWRDGYSQSLRRELVVFVGSTPRDALAFPSSKGRTTGS